MTLGGSSMAAASKEFSWLYQEPSSPCPGFASLPLDFVLRQAVLLAAQVQRALTGSKPRGQVPLPQRSQQEPQADSGTTWITCPSLKPGVMWGTTGCANEGVF